MFELITGYGYELLVVMWYLSSYLIPFWILSLVVYSWVEDFDLEEFQDFLSETGEVSVFFILFTGILVKIVGIDLNSSLHTFGEVLAFIYFVYLFAVY